MKATRYRCSSLFVWTLVLACTAFFGDTNAELGGTSPVASIFASVITTESVADQSGIIPLKSVAGYGPGGLRTLEPELHILRDTPEKIAKYSTPAGIQEIKAKMTQSLAIPIERALHNLPRDEKSKALTGFAVRGKNRDTLANVHRVLVEGGNRSGIFLTDEEVSIVFFTPAISPVTILQKIERKGKVFNINYTLRNRYTANLTAKIVCIPCGKLPAGKYQVTMTRDYEAEKQFNQAKVKPVERGLERRVICRPFSFTQQKGKDAPTSN